MLTYRMEERQGESKYYYLYKQIKEDILKGNLKYGEKLPSKRALAEHLGISLITVENTYQMLKEEGYIETRERSGYFVCKIHGNEHIRATEQQLKLLDESVLEQTAGAEGKDESAFEGHTGVPYSLYFKTVRSVMSEYGETLMQKSPNEGCAILRNSIAEYLLRYRGILAQPKQIIIGSGAEHLYGEVVRLLGNEQIYGLELPSYAQIQKVYESSGAKCVFLKMERDGINVEQLRQSKADVLHVTPFHSYPSGVTASVGKRYAYLEWAKQGNKYIVEDDFDSEFFMPGKPIDTLYMMDDAQRVIYINTFSKSLSPSIRMGYMILPEALVERYERISGDFSCTVPVLEQYALAEFIRKGYFELHLSRMRRRNIIK